ncbi:MAG: hypothetical protein V4577_07470 [Bacteroidota bacterium]
MKTLKILFLVSCASIIIACNSTNQAISGVYILNFRNEFTITNDTLVIEAYNLEAGTYQVQRRAGYRRIHDGKILPKEFSQETWMATFNKEKQVLQETELGRQVYINADGHSLSFEGTYQKIK